MTHKDRLIFLYIGHHDDADRWLKRNKGLEYDAREENGDVLAVQSSEEQKAPSLAEAEEDDYDDILMEKIDHKTLCTIFSGICGDEG